MFLQFLNTADLQDIMRHHGAFGKLLALLDHVALKHNHVFTNFHEMLLLFTRVDILDNN